MADNEELLSRMRHELDRDRPFDRALAEEAIEALSRDTESGWRYSKLAVAIAEAEAALGSPEWVMSKGRLTPDEPLYAFQLLNGPVVVLGEGEDNSPEEAVRLAVVDAKEHRNG